MTLPLTAVAPARTGIERATLVRRTYGLVFLGVIVTMLGTAFCLVQPAMLQAVARHPFIAFLGGFMLPLFLAQRWHREFPRNIGLTLVATFGAGVAISPVIYVMNQTQPGIVSQAGLLTFTPTKKNPPHALKSRRLIAA